MTSVETRPGSLPSAQSSVRTLLDVFDATVARHRDRLAIDADDRRLSYAELAQAAADLAGRLRELGVGPGDRVGVRMSSGQADLYLAILGVLRAGAAYVPVDVDDPPGRADAIFDSCGVCAVVEDGLAITPLRSATGRHAPLTPRADAWIIFTSGSTGSPKGVAVRHEAATAFVEAEARLWTVFPQDRVLAGLSVAFDASCEELWLAWRNGATLVPAPRAIVRSGADLGPWMARRGISVVSTVPTLAAMWDDDALRGVRLLILGGEALPDDLGWRLAAGREVWNTYGPTEATVVSTATRVHPGEPVTIGRPLHGWQVAVVDEHGAPVVPGQAGELVIAGAGLARYLDPLLDAERYAALTARGWARAYRSGDIVRETSDGLAFLGRRDHQVKIGGRRLELGEVEAHLRAVAGVRAAAATVRMTDAGAKVLVGYVVGDADPQEVRATVARSLPDGLAPVVIRVDALPTKTSGKVDLDALPWPVAQPAGEDVELTPTEAWLAEAWAAQLGPFAPAPDANFFDLGGTSVAVARMVSILRERFPDLGVADVYERRTLAELAAHMDTLGGPARDAAAGVQDRGTDRLWGVVRVGGVLVLLAVMACEWLVGVLAYDRFAGGGLPQVSWAWLAVGWLLLSSPMSRSAIVLTARPLLLGRVRPGRYRRASWLACRVWFLCRLVEVCRVGRLAGTPWALRYARLSGADVGAGARLGTLPPPGALVHIGAGATIEPDVDLHGRWYDGQELVVGEIRIGAGARIGMRATLMPGSVVGDGAEVEAGSVVDGEVPAGERWAGSPARRVGLAGERWPAARAVPASTPARQWLLFGAGMCAQTLLPLLAFAPAVALISVLGIGTATPYGSVASTALEVVVLTVVSLLSYALIVAGVVRATGRLLRPGWQADDAASAWALWFSENVMTTARAMLFPLMCSIYMRPWLRLMGIEVGRRTEISTVVGVNRLARFGARSFATDDVALCGARARDGWLQVGETIMGDGTFLGNGALLAPGTTLGDGCLVGVLTTPPADCADGTSWFGAPALELPRVAETCDPARTTDPPRRLVLARGVMDLLRIVLPSTAALTIGFAVLGALQAIGAAYGVLVMALASPLVLLAAGVVAVALTVAVKWTVIGRYRVGEHPLWSMFVWRDELVNSAQEQLAGTWLMSFSIGTPLMSVYLRLLGAKVGRDVWCETMALTEFDLVTLGDGAVVNRHACVETHLFHDRLLRIGPSTFEAGATLGPNSAVLPDTHLGAGCVVGARSVVLRGEALPAGTRWVGAPVIGAR